MMTEYLTLTKQISQQKITRFKPKPDTSENTHD